MSCENWKLSLPVDTTVFATVNLSKGISRIIEYLSHAKQLKAEHQKTCGLLLEMTAPWQREAKIELQSILKKELKNYSLEDCWADNKYLILFF